MQRFLPVKGKLGFNFGKIYPPSFGGLAGKPHLGQDILCPTGSTVIAPTAGVVLETSIGTAAGLMVVLRDADGLIHRLMHNSKFLVKKGDKVTAGQQVAISGNTGTSTAPHSHWDLSKVYPVNPKQFKNFIDPNKWLNENDMSVTPDNANGILYAITKKQNNPESKALADALNTGNQKAVTEIIETAILNKIKQ